MIFLNHVLFYLQGYECEKYLNTNDFTNGINYRTHFNDIVRQLFLHKVSSFIFKL